MMKEKTMANNKDRNTYRLPVGSLSSLSSPSLSILNNDSIGDAEYEYGAVYMTGIYIFRKYERASVPTW